MFKQWSIEADYKSRYKILVG